MPETICAAIRTLWDMEPEALAALVEQLRQDNVTRTRSDRPRYEAWRHSVAAAFTQNIAGRRLSDAKGIPFPPEGEREAVPSETRSQST